MRQRVINHPFDFASVGNKNLAFIRISKNGSTHFCKSFKLNSYLHFDELCGYETYCCLRDPVERFLSSVPETLLRVGNFFSKNKDVIVDNKIFQEICELESISSVNEYLIEFLDIIARYGFFDAHHTPQKYFVHNLPSNVNIKYFLQNDMNMMIQKLSESYHFYKSKDKNTGIQKIRKISILTPMKKPLPSIVHRLIKFPKDHVDYNVRRKIELMYKQDYLLLSDKLV